MTKRPLFTMGNKMIYKSKREIRETGEYTKYDEAIEDYDLIDCETCCGDIEKFAPYKCFRCHGRGYIWVKNGRDATE